MPKNFLGVLTRCRDEYFVQEFCDYYLNQGVDGIHIYDDDSQDKTIYNKVKTYSKVHIEYSKDITVENQFDHLVPMFEKLYEWLIYIDVDEFITTKKNLTNTIRDELETTFSSASCVKVPWVMMTGGYLETNPESILKEIVWRWNHDEKHPSDVHKFRCRYDSIECKSIFKPGCFTSITSLGGKDHVPIGYKNKDKWSLIRESVHNETTKLDPWYYNLREEDIDTGYMLCYHYRIISKENCYRKVKTNNWYGAKENSNFQSELAHALLESSYPEIQDITLQNK